MTREVEMAAWEPSRGVAHGRRAFVDVRVDVNAPRLEGEGPRILRRGSHVA